MFSLVLRVPISVYNILHNRLSAMEAEVVDLRVKYRLELMQRKMLFNKVQELRGNIRVFCRARKVFGA